jgi:TolB-like protein
VRFIFGDRLLDTERRELRCGADLVAVEPQVFDLLVHLLVNCERVVSKDDLVASIWHGRIVSDSTVTSRLNAARKAIGDSGDVQKLIRTIPRKGFRFVGEICTPKSSSKPVAPSIDQARHSKLALPLPDRPAIAVLPFTNMTGDPQQDYFSDGISEDIITALSKLRWFFVIARNSSFTYKGKNVHLSQIAEELGVGYVVEGSVRKDGDRVRITAQLNDAVTGRHIWAERYDRNLADLFAVQDEITDAIVAAIEPQLYAAENFRAQRKPPDSMDAWDLVMRALSHYWRITRQDCLVAQALLEKAIAIDPNYGQALGVLATSHTFSAPWAGKICRQRCGSPRVPHTRRFVPTARILGRTTRWDASICSRGALTIPVPSSSWRYSSIQTFRRPRPIMALCCAIAAAIGTTTRATTKSARSSCGSLRPNVRVHPVCPTKLQRGAATRARKYPSTRRFRLGSPIAYSRRRHGWRR